MLASLAGSCEREVDDHGVMVRWHAEARDEVTLGSLLVHEPLRRHGMAGEAGALVVPAE